MLIKIINSTLNIDIVTWRKEVLDLYPIDFTKKFIPKWFKDAPVNGSDNQIPTGTLKGCVGVQDLFGSGITMPVWSEFIIFKKEEQQIHIEFSDHKTEVEFHSPKQWKYYLDEQNHFHFKIIPPWQIRTKKDTKFLFTGFHWELNPFLIHIPTAIVRFKHQHSCNINGFIKPHEFEKYMFKTGKPLIQLIPLTENRIKLNYFLESPKEYFSDTNKMSLYFINSYKKLTRRLKEQKK